MLCPNPSAGVGEHVWPAWLIGDFHGEGPFHTEKSGTPYKKRDNTTVAKFAALPSVHVPMCANCNARLNTKVEEPAKPVVRRVLPGLGRLDGRRCGPPRRPLGVRHTSQHLG